AQPGCIIGALESADNALLALVRAQIARSHAALYGPSRFRYAMGSSWSAAPKPILSGPRIMSIMTPAAPGKKPVAARGQLAVRELEARLRETQQAVVRQRLTAGACWIVTAMALAVAAMAVVDYFVELSLVWRAVWLIASLAAAIVVGVRGWRRQIGQY